MINCNSDLITSLMQDNYKKKYIKENNILETCVAWMIVKKHHHLAYNVNYILSDDKAVILT